MELQEMCVISRVVAITLLMFVKADCYLHSSGLHVCLDRATNQLPQQPKMLIETYCQPTFKHYYARCSSPNSGYRLCSRYTTMYHIAYRRRYTPPSPVVDQYTCCPGWRQAHKYSKSCTEAVCAQECQNGGKCMRPNNCACPSGWTGQYCEIDVNECADTSHGCQQRCVNTNGSFTCACAAGFTLDEDGKTCSVCISCSPEFQFLTTRLSLVERDVAMLRNQSLQMAAAAAERAPPPVIQARPPQTLSVAGPNVPTLTARDMAQIKRIESLSEQIAMLEERLADCSCRRRNKGKR